MCVEKASDSGTFFRSHLMQFVIKSQGTHTVKSLPLNLDHLRQHKRQLMRAVKINYAHTLAIYGSLFPSWILRIRRVGLPNARQHSVASSAFAVITNSISARPANHPTCQPPLNSFKYCLLSDNDRRPKLSGLICENGQKSRGAKA